MRQSAERQCSHSSETRKKQCHAEKLKDGTADLCAQLGRKRRHCVHLCAHQSSVAEKYKETAGVSDKKKMEIVFVMFLPGLLEYVVLWNLHWSLKKLLSLFTSSQFISVNVFMSFPSFSRHSPKNCKALNTGRFQMQVCLHVCLPSKPLCL